MVYAFGQTTKLEKAKVIRFMHVIKLTGEIKGNLVDVCGETKLEEAKVLWLKHAIKLNWRYQR